MHNVVNFFRYRPTVSPLFHAYAHAHAHANFKQTNINASKTLGFISGPRRIPKTHALIALGSIIVITIPLIIPPLIVGIVQSIAIVAHIVSKPLHIADLLADPAGDILRRVLNIIHSVVPLVLDVVAKAVEALLDVVGDPLDFADFAAGPLGGVLRRVGDVVLDAVFVLVPVFLC